MVLILAADRSTNYGGGDGGNSTSVEAHMSWPIALVKISAFFFDFA